MPIVLAILCVVFAVACVAAYYLDKRTNGRIDELRHLMILGFTRLNGNQSPSAPSAEAIIAALAPMPEECCKSDTVSESSATAEPEKTKKNRKRKH